MAIPQSAALPRGRRPRKTRVKKSRMIGIQMALIMNCGVPECPMKPPKAHTAAPRNDAPMPAFRSRHRAKQKTAATQWISTQYQCRTLKGMCPSRSGMAKRIQFRGLARPG